MPAENEITMEKQLKLIEKDIEKRKLTSIDVSTIWEMGIQCMDYLEDIYAPKKKKTVKEVLKTLLG